jgi:hypothetical protein
VSLLYYAASQRGKTRPRIHPLRAAAILLRAGCNLDIMSIGDAIAVDRVLRYEALPEELKSIAPVLGVDISGALPRLKSGLRPPAATVENVLTPSLRRLIRLRWRREFTAFGYDP